MNPIHTHYPKFKEHQLYELRKTISGYTMKSDMAAATRFVDFLLQILPNENLNGEGISKKDLISENPGQKIWDHQASFWAHVESLPNYFVDMALIFESIKSLGSPKTILSAGCGPGLYELFLEHELGSTIENFFCSDISPRMILQVKENQGRYQKLFSKNSNIQPQVSSLESLPHKDKSVDAIICNKVLHWCSKQDDAVREIYRVLKTGGIAIIILPNGNLEVQPGHVRHFFSRTINSVELGAVMWGRFACRPIGHQMIKFPKPFGQDNNRPISDYMLVVKKQ